MRSITRPQPAGDAAGHLWGIVLSGEQPSPGERPGHPRGSHGARRMPAGSPGLLQQTVEHALRLVPPSQVVAVLDRPHARAYDATLAGLPDVHRVVQPRHRGTAAELFLPLLRIIRQDPQATVVVLRGDRRIEHGARIMQYVARAAWAAALRPDLPIVIGAPRRAARPAYGWTEPGPLVEGLERLAVRQVLRVLHEPSPARRYDVFETTPLLGTLALIAKAQTLVQLGARHLPEVLETLEPLEAAFGSPEEELLCTALYESMPERSVARDLLGRVSHLGVLPAPDVVCRERAPAALERLAS